MINCLKRLTQTISFVPIIFYFGNRSLIAFDEGFYALQAKWILENNNWVAPMWWGNIYLDRTIGIQYCIALSQKFLGNTDIGTILPVTLGGIIMLISTYFLHRELIDNKFPIVSPLILSTTLLWVNYVHMATQDIIFSAFITVGIISSIKAVKTNLNTYLILSGAWLGLAVMMKTYLAIIPLIAIMPFLFSSKIFKKKYFWFGILIGFIPFMIWSISIINNYGFDTYLGLHNKLLFLSKNNNFTNPFYYYLWNIPLNIFPWSIFSIIGLIRSKDLKNNNSKYFLFKYPLIILFLLSLFSTKTPYYPLQFLPIIALNSYLGMIITIKNKNKLLKNIKNLKFIIIPFFILIASLILLFNNLITDIEYSQKLVISFGLFLFSISWLISNFAKTIKSKIILITLGPYLLTTLTVQSGLLTDRSRELRIAGQELIDREKLQGNKIEVIKNNLGNQKSVSKIIKISLLMPKIGNGIEKIEDLKMNEYAWINKSNNKVFNNDHYLLINDSEIFFPWKLIKRIK